MNRPLHARPRRSSRRWWFVSLFLAGTATGMVILAGTVEVPLASASPTAVGLGKATPFAVLGGTEVTNTGASVITGDLGVSPGSSVTGTPQVKNGTIYAATAVAATAQAALGTAYTDAAGRTPTTPANFSSSNLGGKSLASGVYKATSTLRLTGTLTLNGNGDPNAVFVFQAGSTLVTASNSTVKLTGGAQACNVFWKVGSSATLGSTSTFVGSVLALTSVTVTTKVTVTGRVLARNGAVTLIDDTITRPATCVTATSTTSTTSTTSAVGTPTTTAPVTVIPVGAPQTGLGGASRSGPNAVFMAVGALALAGAGVSTVMAIRRRRVSAVGTERDSRGTSEDG